MVEVFPRCRSQEVPEDFEEVLRSGWSGVFDFLGQVGVGVIAGFEDLEISLLDDDEMARVHGEFLNDETTTDVITFAHGEILVGVEVAVRQAGEFGTRPDREVALYGIHGMLHLSGFDDGNPDEARKMVRKQEELLEAFFGDLFRSRRFF